MSEEQAAALAGVDVQALAREIAVRMAPDALLEASDVGAMLKCSPRYVLEHYVTAPGFPKPLRLTAAGGVRSKPRWLRGDLTKWIESHVGGQSKRGGRPRNIPLE